MTNPSKYVSGPILDCEACMTPDACAIRGQCAHYLRERDASAPTPPAEAQAEPVDERAEFEAWALANQFEIHRDDTDKYRDYHRATTRWAWMAWQAARSTPAQPPQAQGGALRAALERIWAEAHYSGSPELGLRRMPPALRAAIEDSRAALTATPPAPPAVEPSSIDPWRMRIAAIAAECSDHDTTDALDALLADEAPAVEPASTLQAVEPTEEEILTAAHEAGLWPNTVHTWVPAFHRYHTAMSLILAARVRRDQENGNGAPAVEPSSLPDDRRLTLVHALMASKGWMRGYAEAFVDDFAAPQPQAAQDAADAARYRWLRSGRLLRQGHDTGVGRREIQRDPTRATMSFGYWCSPDDLDAAIDAELRAGAGGKSANSGE